MLNGILNIYKEKGFTSHDVVAKLRGITKQKKIGHTGTLDPDAEGVLPVCLGRATKVCALLTEKDKIYETTLLLGKMTDTQDISGTVLKERDTKGLTEQDVRKCIDSYVGTYDQLPPMYSALKVKERGCMNWQERVLKWKENAGGLRSMRLKSRKSGFRGSRCACIVPREHISARFAMISARVSGAAAVWRRCCAQK